MPSYISSNLSANLIKKAFLELNYSKMFFCSSPLSVQTNTYHEPRLPNQRGFKLIMEVVTHIHTQH